MTIKNNKINLLREQKKNIKKKRCVYQELVCK